MKKVILQLWEESDSEIGITPDGCSLHLDRDSLKSYIDNIYCNRSAEVPTSYDRVSGDCVEVYVDESMFKFVEQKNYIRLQQNEMNNLINLKELTYDI